MSHRSTPRGPLVVEPRLDSKPWGGRRLERFGLALPPDEPIGEALVTAMDASMPTEGVTLGAIVEGDPATSLGALSLTAVGGRSLFPLLIKLIDAAAPLSIQVHPDDVAARAHDRLGKTEAWHVLAAEPGAALYLGLQPGVTMEAFAAACRAARGDTAALLRQIPAVPGTTVLIPAGTVHALGAGVVVYEVQQPSDLTFRLDDWGRVDGAGRSRELHLDAGLAVLDPRSMPDLIPPISLRTAVSRRQVLAACRYFALERIALVTGEELALPLAGSPSVLTVLRGAAAVVGNGETVQLALGRSAVLLANAAPATITAAAPVVLLRAWVPDLVGDVIGPSRAAGADAGAIAALAGSLPDLSEAWSA